jgi:hypothetical protein
MDRHTTHPNVARQVVAVVATLGLVIAGFAFVVAMANAAPGERTVQVRQQAPAVSPVIAPARRTARTRTTRARRTARVRLSRLPDFRRLRKPKMLGFQWPTVGTHSITSPFGPRHDEFHHGPISAAGSGSGCTPRAPAA